MPIFNYYINYINDLLPSELPLQDCFCCSRLSLGHHHRGSSGGRQSCAIIAGNNPFLLHDVVQSGFQGVKAKFPFPQSFSTMAEITPTESLVGEVPETSENPMQSSLFTKWEVYASLRHCVACYAP